MKNWQETQLVFEEIAKMAKAGRKSVLATIVKLQGSAYRQAGAKLLVRDDGTMIGNVSGGCLESDVRENAMTIMKKPSSRKLTYDTSGKEDAVWGLGVGCGGVVDIFMQTADAFAGAAVVEDVLARLQGDRPFSICTVLTGPSAGQIVVGASEVRDQEVFVETLSPPPRLIVCGAQDSAIPLARLAADAGFRVTVTDHRGAFVSAERFPSGVKLVQARPEDDAIAATANTFAVVMTHILTQDRGWVQRFAKAGIPYVGVLGSKTRRNDILSGLSEDERKNIFGPVGLDIGAEGPEQVAVAIVAEMLAVWSGRNPQHLRDRKQAIHG
jgi:xanthine/CO dehydrogenase XdhC/CoxF family maturation factor